MHRICALCGHFNFNRNCLKIHASHFPCFFFYLSNEKSFIFMVFILVMVQIDIQE